MVSGVSRRLVNTSSDFTKVVQVNGCLMGNLIKVVMYANVNSKVGV